MSERASAYKSALARICVRGYVYRLPFVLASCAVQLDLLQLMRTHMLAFIM